MYEFRFPAEVFADFTPIQFLGRLDALIPADKPISVLKVDTEGADLWVLMGAEELLRRKQIQNIFYESNVERMQLLGIGPDEAAGFLHRFHYKVTQFGDEQFHAAPI